MSYHHKFRPYAGMTALAQFLESTTIPQPTFRITNITERREIKVIERKAASQSAAPFTIPPAPAETTRKWSSERVAEIVEMFE